MSDYQANDDDVQILIEFSDSPTTGAGSVGEVYRGGRGRRAEPTDIEAKSRTALDNAMSAIKGMARRVAETSSSLKAHEKPSQIEVEFALKLTSEAGVYVAKAGTEASFNVKLIWEGQKDEDAGQ
jgi:hypothetical protein